MQVFVLDPRPEVCAQYHCDQHVKAMCAEYAQLLTTEDTSNDIVNWARYSIENYDWLHELLFWINMEYRWRFRRGNHRLADRVLTYDAKPKLPSLGFTIPPVLVPPRFHDEDPIVAYRRYYYARKRHRGRWSKRPVPWFMIEKLALEELAA